MSDDGVTRRLAAIVAADVAGYSRLMGTDEEGTLRELKAHRSELIDPKMAEHRGRIVKTTGDGMLSEFPSVVDALLCCLEVQEAMLERNGSLPPERRIQFRIGVNLGDIIIDGDDIFGDGVNIAARLEAMAPPGGICISSAVLDQVKQKLQIKTEDMGERALKNIEAPVHAYRIMQGPGLPGPAEAAVAEETVIETLGLKLPERPAIAIMPFRNLSGAEHDYVADGIGLGIQTLMVQLSGMFLINATADQSYKSGEKSAADVARDLPVRYTLEGTTQVAGQRVRVTVQLTDLESGIAIWAERYDRDLEDIFALQDEITKEVVSSLNVELFDTDLGRIVTKDLRGDGTWEFFLRGISHVYKFNAGDNERARAMFEKLYALRPESYIGPGYIALTHWLDATRGWTSTPEQSLQLAAEFAAKSVQFDQSDGIGHVVMSYFLMREGRYDEALAMCEKAVEFRANCPAALGQSASIKLYSGDAEGAIKSAREAMSVRILNPPLLFNLLANAYRDSGKIDLSIPAACEAARIDPNFTDALATLCSDYVLSGEIDEARRVAKDLIEIDPSFRVGSFAKRHPYRDRTRLDGLAAALRSAGLPG